MDIWLPFPISKFSLTIRGFIVLLTVNYVLPTSKDMSGSDENFDQVSVIQDLKIHLHMPLIIIIIIIVANAVTSCIRFCFQN